MSNKEELLLEAYFRYLSEFSLDKAKDLIEKDKDIQRISSSSVWGQFLHLLVQFATAEKTYMSLTFLAQKWFGRSRDSLRHSYQLLSQEFRKLEDVAGKQQSVPHSCDDFEALISHLSGQLNHFVTARQKTMDFYEQITAMSGTRNMIYDDLVDVISEIMQAHKKNFHHPILSSLKSGFSCECDVVHHLLQAQVFMTEWQFLPSLLQLHQAHSKLTSWGAGVLTKEDEEVSERLLSQTAMKVDPSRVDKKFSFLGKESKKSTFGSSSRNSHLPALYQWLLKYKCLLISKFSFYFYEVLSKQTVPQEMKNLQAKTSEDFVYRVVVFQRKSDATHINLVLDTHGIEETYKGNGYYHPNRQYERPTGLSSYPSIFSYPGEYPSKQWPSIIMRITENESDSDKINYFYDKTVQNTYFIISVDNRIYLVLVFECKKSEKDSYINNFLIDMSQHLKCIKLFNSLKPGVK